MDIVFKEETNEQKDYKKYFKEKGDPGFSPERNKDIVESTIKKYEAKKKLESKIFNDSLGERVEAAASYAQYLDSGGAQTVESYFGKKYLSYLHAQDFANKVKGRILTERILKRPDIRINSNYDDIERR